MILLQQSYFSFQLGMWKVYQGSSVQSSGQIIPTHLHNYWSDLRSCNLTSSYGHPTIWPSLFYRQLVPKIPDQTSFTQNWFLPLQCSHATFKEFVLLCPFLCCPCLEVRLFIGIVTLNRRLFLKLFRIDSLILAF